MTNKPYSQACENNKKYILPLLQQAFLASAKVLEVGSGSGQHAVFFAQQLDHLQWQTSDLLINHEGINQWITEYPSVNLLKPIELNLEHTWPVDSVDAIYTANTLHIVSWSLVKRFFEGVQKHLASAGKLCIYGPFNYDGQYTRESNANFDIWLKNRDEQSGIRNIEDILILADTAGLTLKSDHEMPANNRLLEFVKNK